MASLGSVVADDVIRFDIEDLRFAQGALQIHATRTAWPGEDPIVLPAGMHRWTIRDRHGDMVGVFRSSTDVQLIAEPTDAQPATMHLHLPVSMAGI